MKQAQDLAEEKMELVATIVDNRDIFLGLAENPYDRDSAMAVEGEE